MSRSEQDSGHDKSKLGLEQLESRLAPAAVVTATLSAGVLKVEGTDVADEIVVRQTNNRITVGGTTFRTAAWRVTGIEIFGRAGDDHIRLNDEADPGQQPITAPVRVWGGTGADEIIPWLAAGSLMVWGEDGNDGIAGGQGSNSLNGGPGDDTLMGGTGRNVLRGGDGNDQLWGEPSGSGNDTLYGGGGDDTLAGGNGNDVLWGEAGHDTMYGDDGDDYLDGGEGNDTLTGGGGSNTLLGRAGDDRLTGGDGPDLLYGNSGHDLLDGGGGNDDLVGGDGSEILSGGSGDDQLWGEEGSDQLEGGDGNDRLYGGAGNDLCLGGNGDDLTSGGGGDDTCEDSAGQNTLQGGGGVDSLYGGSGADSLDGGGGNDGLFGWGGNDTLWGGDGDDNLFGGDGNDNVYGGAGYDVLTGDAGSDLLLGEGGYDLLADLGERNPLPGSGFGLTEQVFKDYTRGVPAVQKVGDARAAEYDEVTQRGSPSCFLAAAISAVIKAGFDLTATTRIRHIAGTDRYVVTLYVPDVSSATSATNFNVTRFTTADVEVTFDGRWDDKLDLEPTAEGDFWATLIQRAYRQQFGLPDTGGDFSFALMVLTGKANQSFDGTNEVPGKPNTIWIYGSKTPNQASDPGVIAAALAANRAVVAGTIGDSKTGKKRILDTRTGLITNHAYTVVGIDIPANGGQIRVTIRNPWGYDTDHDQRATYDDGLGHNFDDGLVRITWGEFKTYFTRYALGVI